MIAVPVSLEINHLYLIGCWKAGDFSHHSDDPRFYLFLKTTSGFVYAAVSPLPGVQVAI